MKIIALLPMKGNSERVPNKNLKDFNGAPLYHAVMKTLLAVPQIDEVIVNTDSELIEKDIKFNFPTVKIHHRPSEIQGDFVSMNEIINNDLINSDGDIYIQTHSTNPILESGSIQAAINTFQDNSRDFDSLFSVTRLQTRLYKKDGSALNHNPEELLRTQDLEPLFEENSCFFIFTKESFSASGNKRIGKKPYLFEIDKLEAVDIDEPSDFELAEALYEIRKS